MEDFVAPRPDGSLARYRWKLIGGQRIAVDKELSELVVKNYPNFPSGMRAAQNFWGCLSSLVFVGGFVALIWWPWWVPIIGVVVAYILFRTNKSSAADFVAQVAEQVPEFAKEMESKGVLRPASEFARSTDD